MSKTVYYYNCYITYNGEKTTIPLTQLLDNLIGLQENQRYKEFNNGSFSLIHMNFPDPNSQNFQDRTVAIASYRERKPFLGTRGIDRADEIDDDVLEMTTCMFIPTYDMVMIEYNHFGCRPRNIEVYLSSFLPKDEDNSWAVELIEIEPELGLTDIRESNDIRKIELQLDLTTNSRRQIVRHQQQEPVSIFANLISRTVDVQNQFGGNVGSIILGNGRKKENLLDRQMIIELLNSLDLESDLFAAIKVTYYSPNRRRVITQDLKNQGVLKDVIDCEGDSWEAIGAAMYEKFYNNGRQGNDGFHRFLDEKIPADLPRLNIRED
ncbi:DUF6731 family protein [Cytobacillus firmus]|uniref:DUF6731 family protein n=1 Tax=Cytobacillus firmus TaxID=1399 RepID=UPI00222823CC|nr:DUF6731 family protein [Cytobacillus firmus]